MSAKFSVLRTLAVAGISTVLVVCLGALVMLSGGSLPVGTAEVTTAGGSPSPEAGGSTSTSTSSSSTDDGSEAKPRPEAKPGPEAEKSAKRSGGDRDEPRRTEPARDAKPDKVGRSEESILGSLAVLAQKQVGQSRRSARADDSPVSLTISSFNILGSQHTSPGGSARGYAPGRIRAEWAARLVRDRGVDIVGWSEIQADQFVAMMRATGGAYEAWPGLSFGQGAKGVAASLMWRKDRWEAVWKGTVSIPFMNQQRLMPIVQLRSLETGREIYVMNVHNAPQGREAERNVAESRELSMIRSIRQESGQPVLLTGDFNEHAEIFCNVVGGTDLHAANGGSFDGACRPPAGRLRVDWIFGSPEATFNRYVAERSPLVRRISDHAALFTSVTVN